jgi:hypothetical protein
LVINIKELATNTLDSIAESKYTKELLKSNGDIPCFAIGKNTESLALNAVISLDGIIDDFKENENHWNGILLVSTA